MINYQKKDFQIFVLTNDSTTNLIQCLIIPIPPKPLNTKQTIPTNLHSTDKTAPSLFLKKKQHSHASHQESKVLGVNLAARRVPRVFMYIVDDAVARVRRPPRPDLEMISAPPPPAALAQTLARAGSEKKRTREEAPARPSIRSGTAGEGKSSRIFGGLETLFDLTLPVIGKTGIVQDVEEALKSANNSRASSSSALRL